MNPSRHTRFPDLASEFSGALADEPVLLDGMKVLFDRKVGLYPVNLEQKAEHPSHGHAAHTNGHGS